MPSQSFIQLFGLLAQMADRKHQQAIAERELDQQDQKFQQAVKEFDIQHKDKDTAEALKALAGSSLEGRQALLQLYKSGHFTPQELDAFSKFASGQPVDPAVLGAQSAQAGYGALTPGMRGQVDQEAAVRAGTGMNAGQLAGSQLMAPMASGGALPPGLAAQGVTPQAWGQFVQNFAARQSQGYTPEQMGVQQGQLGIQKGQLELGWANLRQEDRKLLAETGLKELFGKAQGQLTPAETSQTMQGIGNLLDAMNKSTADNAGNMARQRVIGQLSLLLGLPSNYFVPQPEGPNAPGQTPTPATPFRQFWQGNPGFAPGMVGPGAGIPRF